MLILLLVILISSLYYYLVSNNGFWEKKNVAFRKPVLVFGNITDRVLQKIPLHDFMQQYYQEYHKTQAVVGMFEGREPRLLVLDINLVKDMFIRDFDHFTDRSVFDFKEASILKDLMLLSPGPIWKNTRSKLTPAFSSGKLKAMDELIQRCSEQMANNLAERPDQNEELNLKEFFGLFTLDVISSCAFGIECNSWRESTSPFVKALQKFDYMTSFRRFQLLMCLVLVPTFMRKYISLWVFNKDTCYFIADIIRKSRDYRVKNNVRRNDFLQLLLDIQSKEEEEKSDNRIMTLDNIISESILFMVAGFETSSTLLAFATYELALNPDIQNKLRQEINSTLSKHDGKCTYDAIQDMDYLEMVLCETLRKHSPVSRIDRVCVKNYKVRGMNLELEKGVNISVPAVGFHYDPNFFPDPERFDPLRFSETRTPDGFLAFGLGPRNCIGKRFALISTKFAMVSLITKYSCHRTEKTEVPYQKRINGILLAPKYGLFVRISKLPEYIQ